MIIAIDGTAAAAKHAGEADRGALRAAALGHRLDLPGRGARRCQGRARLTDIEAAAEAARNLDASTLSDPELRLKGTGEAASVVAAYPEVRAALLAYQRAFAANPGGAVLEGRDIGTVVCPGAHAKIFVSASAQARAARRYVELRGYGVDIAEETVLREIEDRDRRDRERPVSPLIPAKDALLLDTTELDIEKALAAALELIDKAAGLR